MKAPYTQFGITLAIPLVTYTDGEKDDPPKKHWKDTIWIERGEDWYAFLNKEFAKGTVRVVERDLWIKARRQEERDAIK